MSNRPNGVRGNGNGALGFGGARVPNPPRQQVNLNDLPEMECNCGNKTFVMGMGLRFASRLVSANGQPTVVQVPAGWVCTQCGVANDFAYKKELDEIIKPPIENPEANLCAADYNKPEE